MTPELASAVFQGFAAAVGLTLGSFANVCIDRLPHDRSLWPRSACDACAHPIRARDLVPVLSFALLRGRCRDCGARIPPHVPLVEVLVGLLAVMLWRRLIPTVDAIDAAHLLAWGHFLVFLTLLVVASYVDVRHRIIPDQTSLLAVPWAVVATAGLGAAGYDGWLHQPWSGAIGGALLGGGMFAFTAIAARALRGVDALGWGDVKLVAMIGAFLGPMPGVMLVMLVGSLIGATVGLAALLILRARSWLPFGPSLAVAAAIYVFWGRHLVDALFPGMGQFLE